MPRRKSVNDEKKSGELSKKSSNISGSFRFILTPSYFRPCSLRQEGGRGRSGHCGKPRRRQDHCGGGHRECPPSSTDQLNISCQKLKDFCWGGPNIVPRQEWIKSGLVFHSPEQTNAYGLNTTKGATKAFQIVLGMVTSRS